jgi:formylglycine-generating enzyme required for sulfatase activity
VATPAQPHYYDSAEFDRFPAVSVTWDDARSYCAWRGRRLPTEAEWERAARGDDGRLFPWGGNWDPARMQLSGDDRLGELAMVGNFPKNASPYGALDMSGNVWEWTSSRDMVYPYAAGDGREEPTLSGKRIVRGGAWGSNMHNARATTRDSHDPDDTFWNRGFRCAATIGGPTRNDQLAGLPAAPEGMVAVPGGMLRMGTDEAEARRWALD